MGNKNQKQSLNEINSNSSVLNLSLESNKESSPDSLKIHNNNNDLIKELKNEVDLPIENELPCPAGMGVFLLSLRFPFYILNSFFSTRIWKVYFWECYFYCGRL